MWGQPPPLSSRAKLGRDRKVHDLNRLRKKLQMPARPVEERPFQGRVNRVKSLRASDSVAVLAGRVVLGIKDFTFIVSHSSPAAADCAALLERWLPESAKKKVAPLSTSASAQIRPSCFWIMR